MREMKLQEKEEIKLGLVPASPSATLVQARMQLSFSDIIVQPYVDALRELFPRMLNVSDLINLNSARWMSMLPDAAPQPKQHTYMTARRGANVKERRTTDGDDKKVDSGMAKTNKYRSFNDSADLKNLSLALPPGVLELPENLQKYLALVEKNTTSAAISAGIRKFSIAQNHNRLPQESILTPMRLRSNTHRSQEGTISHSTTEENLSSSPLKMVVSPFLVNPDENDEI